MNKLRMYPVKRWNPPANYMQTRSLLVTSLRTKTLGAKSGYTIDSMDQKTKNIAGNYAGGQVPQSWQALP